MSARNSIRFEPDGVNGLRVIIENPRKFSFFSRRAVARIDLSQFQLEAIGLALKKGESITLKA